MDENISANRGRNIVIFDEDNSNPAAAQMLADRLGLEIISKIPGMEDADECAKTTKGSDNHRETDQRLVLRISKAGIALASGSLELRGDFMHMLPRTKLNNLNGELLIKTAKIKSFDDSPTAFDATAGLGEDSFLLSAAGFKVDMYEYNPIIAVLLKDALRRAAAQPELSDIAGRMTLHEEDSIMALSKLQTPPDLILLDPMFPVRQKNALVKKKLQIIKQLESPCSDESELLAAAMRAKPKKIIIKRPAKGSYLAGIKPSYSITGNSIRYDCIVLM